MILTDLEISDLITKEFREKSLGVTEQYLEIHQPVFEEGVVKIDRIDRERQKDTIVAYLPVKDEYFHFAIYIDSERTKIFNIDTEARNRVSLYITSDELSQAELIHFKNIIPSRVWNKGEKIPNRNAEYRYSLIEYEPNPEPDEFEDKLKKLLLLLSDNKTDLLEIVSSNADVSINVTIDFHHGNQLLGATSIDLDCLRLMVDLKLPIHFKFAAWGNSFK